MIQRGDVMVEFPYTDVARSKVRPAVVVQNNRDNQRLRKTIVAMITGNLRRRGDRIGYRGGIEICPYT
jgi:mRNA interferase MazF